jgi:AAHS family 4-hydroxybenzoate transporter-like MFS transporter
MARETRPGVEHASSPIDVGRLIDEGHWGARQKLFVSLTALTIIFDGIDNQLLAISIPALIQDWSVARRAFAPVLASGMIGMMVGGTIGGMAGDRFGRRGALIASVLVFGILTGAVAFVNSLTALAVLRFLAGIGLGGAMPNAAALASEYVPRRHRPFAVTLTIVCIPLGGTLAAFLGGRALPVLGWRALFAIGGLLSGVVAIIAILGLPESPRYLTRQRSRWPELSRTMRRLGYQLPADSAFVDHSENAIARASVSALFTPEYKRDTVALAGAYFFCLLGVYMAFNWVPAVLTDAGLGLIVASNGLAAFNLGGVAGAIAGAWLIGRFGSRPTMPTMAGVAVAGALGLAAMPIVSTTNPLSVVIMLGVTGGMINGVQTTMYALAAHVYPTAVRATGVGTAVAVGRFGGVLSPYVGAWTLESGGSRVFFGTIAAAMTLVLSCLAIIRRHVPSPRSDRNS